MNFHFPKDEELFEDLPTVRTEQNYELEELVDVLRDGSETDFGSAFRKGIEEVRKTPMPTAHIEGDSWFSILSQQQKHIEGFTRSLYEKLEVVADRFAEKNKITAFPKTFVMRFTYRLSDESATKHEYHLDYFDEMDKAFGFMEGAGRTGEVLKSAKAELDTIEKKVPLIARSTLVVLLVGILVTLAGAMPFPFLPQFVAELVSTSRIARLAVLLPMSLTGWYLLSVGPPDKNLKGRFLLKFVSGGIFLIAAAFGSTLFAVYYAFSKAPPEYFVLLPFGLYYIIYSLFRAIENMRQRAAAKKAGRKAKKNFCTLVEENIYSLHRYLRFHTLWWQAQKPRKQPCSGIENLQKSFDHLLKKYEEYH